MDLPKSFWDRVEKIPGGCWEWTGHIRDDGYVHISMIGFGMEYIHRMSHMSFIGPIPDGYEVDHLCFNRSCVNPDHLEAVTHQENCRRAALRNYGDIYARKNFTRCDHQRTAENTEWVRPASPGVCRQCRIERHEARTYVAWWEL